MQSGTSPTPLPDDGDPFSLPAPVQGLLAGAALLLEAKAAWEFLRAGAGAASFLPPLLLLHAAACALMAGYACLRRGAQGMDRSWFGFVFAFCLALPALGMIGLLAAVLPALGRREVRARAGYAAIGRERPTDFPERYPSRYGPGGFRARLLSRRIPSASRLAALLALRHRSTPRGNRLMKEMLKDPADELRLMAYGTLERREMEHQKAIGAAAAALREARGPDARRACLRRLAFLQWEMAYQELAEGELARFYLEQALESAAGALALDPSDGALALLKGRIQARLGSWDEALETLDAADRLGAPAERLIPHQAELAFMRRDFAETRRLLARARAAGAAGGGAMDGVLRFWLGRRR